MAARLASPSPLWCPEQALAPGSMPGSWAPMTNVWGEGLGSHWSHRWAQAATGCGSFHGKGWSRGGSKQMGVPAWAWQGPSLSWQPLNFALHSLPLSSLNSPLLPDKPSDHFKNQLDHRLQCLLGLLRPPAHDHRHKPAGNCSCPPYPCDLLSPLGTCSAPSGPLSTSGARQGVPRAWRLYLELPGPLPGFLLQSTPSRGFLGPPHCSVGFLSPALTATWHITWWSSCPFICLALPAEECQLLEGGAASALRPHGVWNVQLSGRCNGQRT